MPSRWRALREERQGQRQTDCCKMKNAEPIQFESDATSLSGLYHVAVWKLFGSRDAETTFRQEWGLGDEVEFELVKRIHRDSVSSIDRAKVIVSVTQVEARYLLHLLHWFFEIDDGDYECGALTGVSAETVRALMQRIEVATR
jgi:hypothetical protein